MSLEFVRKLPTPTEIREQYPLSARATEIKKQRDAEIAKVFTGDSDKFLVIVGPCSADNEDAVLEYNHRLAKVADKVSDKLIIIPRVYTNKPLVFALSLAGNGNILTRLSLKITTLIPVDSYTFPSGS